MPVDDLILIALGIAWLATGYGVGAHRIRTASEARLRDLTANPRWAVIGALTIGAVLWPIMGEMA